MSIININAKNNRVEKDIIGKEKMSFKEKIEGILKKVDKVFKSMDKDHISEYTSQCSYYTILSFIPFVILIITLIQYTGLDKDVMFNAFSKIIPDNMNGIVIKIIDEVYTKSIGTISISIIFTLLSAGKGLYALTKGLHSIYKTNEEEKTNYLKLRFRAIISTLLFIVLFVLGLAALVFSNSLISIIKNKFDGLKNFTFISGLVTKLLFLAVTIVIFMLIYRFLPKHKVSFKSQVYGAIFGGIALNVISYVFAKYLDIFKNFSITYGSLTALMLVMMWTYSCFYAVFLGAEVNKLIALKKRKNNKAQNKELGVENI